jgi:hypothetical protein
MLKLGQNYTETMPKKAAKKFILAQQQRCKFASYC